MTLTEQVYAQACMLSDAPDRREQELLRTLCRASTAALKSRLREGLTPDDCRADFVAAASLYALASMATVSREGELDEMKLGDVTMKRRQGDPASKCLYNQADLIMAPYLADGFSFRGV